MKKVLKVKLESEVHDKFRTWAFNHRVTMQGELERHVGGLVAPEAPSGPRKQPKEASKVVGGGSVKIEPPKPVPSQQPEKWVSTGGPGSVKLPIPAGLPVDPAEVKMAKCRKCGESFPVADMVTEPKSGKLFCGDCVENMKNGQ